MDKNDEYVIVWYKVSEYCVWDLVKSNNSLKIIESLILFDRNNRIILFVVKFLRSCINKDITSSLSLGRIYIKSIIYWSAFAILQSPLFSSSNINFNEYFH